MVAGVPSYRQSTYSSEHPPTLFHPASPKMEAVKDTKEVDDNASMVSTSTYRSTVNLLKSKLPSSKDRKARKEAEAVAARSTVLHDDKVVEKKSKDSKTRKPIPPPDWDSRARTAEAYMVQAMMR